MTEEAIEKISRQVERIAVETLRGWVGAKGTVADTGEGGGPDFEIHYADGRTGIGEVGLHEDPSTAAAWAAIHKSDTPQQITLPPGTGMWGVGFAVVPNIKRVHRELFTLITFLQEEGLTELHIQDDYPRGKAADFARVLGVNYLSFHEDGTADLATFFLPFTGGIVPTDSNLIVDWVEEVLLSDDFKDSWTKLLPFQCEEKHVFFMTSNRTPFGIDELLRRPTLPMRAPNLPGGLTHIWIASRYGDVGAIYWSADSGWQHYEP